VTSSQTNVRVNSRIPRNSQRSTIQETTYSPPSTTCAALSSPTGGSRSSALLGR
jgi:hypothetical protein